MSCLSCSWHRRWNRLQIQIREGTPGKQLLLENRNKILQHSLCMWLKLWYTFQEHMQNKLKPSLRWLHPVHKLCR